MSQITDILDGLVTDSHNHSVRGDSTDRVLASIKEAEQAIEALLVQAHDRGYQTGKDGQKALDNKRFEQAIQSDPYDTDNKFVLVREARKRWNGQKEG